MGTLFLVGTPIGNLEDISARAVGILHRVDVIASENPQRTQRLLARYDINTPMVRYTDAYDRRKHSRIQAVLDALREGDVALVSEAGMPGLADPGYELLHAVIERGFLVEPIPGPTALSATLSVSGIPSAGFIFLGFLPRGRAGRHGLLASLAKHAYTLVAYESPHRLLDTLADLEQLFDGRPMVVACELTKLYEEVRRGTASELLVHYRDYHPRGEFTLVIAPWSDPSSCTGEDKGAKG